ncbi:MAG: hypothetical protein HYU34_00470 [Candidatus Omnitrophica bacterium]|nr:hypothetical protein [Candidatus Omnitrophota bacterium]
MKGLIRILNLILVAAILFIVGQGIYWIAKRIEENQILKGVITRLSSDSRVAEVLVTQSRFNEETKKIETTIKFLEYDAEGKPLEPRYFTFQGNIIQFQSLVIRFQDRLVEAGDSLRGKSAYLFLKAFVLDETKTQVFPITEANTIPAGYKVPGIKSEFEQKLWEEFWNYALDPRARERSGIKNAQIEAPGSMFLPGTIYTIKIEHDGGLRIDTRPVPEILKGEKV